MTMLYSKGIHVKNINNFKKAMESDLWPFFEKFTMMMNNNLGMLDWKKFIEVLAEHYKNRFHPKLLIHPSAIKLYKHTVNINNLHTDDKVIENLVISDIKFLVDFCNRQLIHSLEDYLKSNELVPLLAVHFNAGSISIYLIAMIHDIKKTIRSYPKDVQDEFFYGIENKIDVAKKLVLKNTKLNKISDNIFILINKKLTEKKGIN